MYMGTCCIPNKLKDGKTMSIVFDENKRVFKLDTEKSSYASISPTAETCSTCTTAVIFRKLI